MDVLPLNLESVNIHSLTPILESIPIIMATLTPKLESDTEKSNKTGFLTFYVGIGQIRLYINISFKIL